MGTGGSFPGVKQQGRKADHSTSIQCQGQKLWSSTSTPHLHGVVLKAQGPLYLFHSSLYFTFSPEDILNNEIQLSLFYT
jgi:hypothetical protein